MKKLFICLFALLCGIPAFAQQGISGIKSGTNENVTIDHPRFLVFAGFAARVENEGIYQFGAGVKIPLKYGFSLQPEIFYDKRYTEFLTRINTGSSVMVTTPFLEFPVQIQWGKDFGGVRPYLFVSPFMGVGLGSVKGRFKTNLNNSSGISYDATSFRDSGIKPFILGGGAGIGIEVLKQFQLSVQYNSSVSDFINYHVENDVVRQFWTDYKETGNKGRKFFEDFFFQVTILF